MTQVQRLQSITVSNFRSIRGQVRVPLDAPVILLHGLNGTGKTSLLSALELALAGSIDSMRRGDPHYLEHLVHRGANAATVSLEMALIDGSVSSWSTTSDADGWAKDHFLGGEDADFYRERSYLAQATLGRLLEIYEKNDSPSGSALTKFVNDVLGLDSLESLINGLSEARDVRNTRHLVPEIADLEREVRAMESQAAENTLRVSGLRAETKRLDAEIRGELESIAEQLGELLDFEELTIASVAESDEAALVALAGLRREVDSMTQRLDSAEKTAIGLDLVRLEQRAVKSSTRADAWRASAGVELERVLTEVGGEFPDLPSLVEVGPSGALRAALERVDGELKRTSDLLALDDKLNAQNENLGEVIALAEARRAIVNEQIAAEVSGAGEIARIISELIPHLHDDECAVCGRNYSEVSDESLSAYASRRVASLSVQAKRVAELSEARATTLLELEKARDELNTNTARVLSTSARSSLISKRASVSKWADFLRGSVENAEHGAELLRESSDDRRSLIAVRDRAQVWEVLQDAVHAVMTSLGLARAEEIEPLRSQFARASEEIRARITRLELRVETRRKIAELDRRRQVALGDLANARHARDQLATVLRSNNAKRAAVDVAREQATRVRRTAIETQGSIVRKVFNESLNSVWRDLFVRLAPTEPFVPAFHVSSDTRETTPHLVTKHRGGGNGGSPGTMLSSGNLNTAALTLFLALHLSSGRRLPLLVLDDPVQSMDDVHISQFAALLRTLSKQHGRQILVAVHERALFDYLALELSPAFEGDSLLTVELRKRADGSTIAEPLYHAWREDPVSAAAG